MKCQRRTEVFSRVVGFFRPVQNWNAGKKEEYKDRKNFKQENLNEKTKSNSKDGTTGNSR